MAGIAYFAYGSNMDPATLRGRRGIQWSRAAAARTKGWRLTLDKPSLVGGYEATATIVEEPGCEVWGVLYEISATDFEHLELTEGVLIEHYARTEILVEPAASWNGADGASMKAFTFTSPVRDPALRPSTRYKNLLVSGASEHGLPADWIEQLRAIEAVEESPEMAVLRPMFDLALRRRG